VFRRLHLNIMDRIIFCILLLCAFTLDAQNSPKPEDWGLSHIPFVFEDEPVDIVLLSGGTKYDTLKKPLFLFVQGSLPKPLLISNKSGAKFSIFPFNPMVAFEDYHFVMIAKPAVPLLAFQEELQQPNLLYVDPKTNQFPHKYCENNHLDFYVKRNLAVLDFLSSKDWVESGKVVVAGHSEGVSIAYKMALEYKPISHLIMLNAGLAGRMTSILANRRKRDTTLENHQETEELFKYFKFLAETEGEGLSDDCSLKDSDKATASFSYPFRNHISELDIPIFFGYGTRDESVLLMDYLRIQVIEAQKSNYLFKSYFRLEHNFFGLDKEGRINYEDYRFDKVASDFFEWLNAK